MALPPAALMRSFASQAVIKRLPGEKKSLSSVLNWQQAPVITYTASYSFPFHCPAPSVAILGPLRIQSANVHGPRNDPTVTLTAD